MFMDDTDVYHCYNNLWKTAQERENAQYQGIDESDDRNTKESELVLEIRMHLLQQTRPLPLLIAIDSTSHWISICSRATCRSIRARSGNAWNMN